MLTMRLFITLSRNSRWSAAPRAAQHTSAPISRAPHCCWRMGRGPAPDHTSPQSASGGKHNKTLLQLLIYILRLLVLMQLALFGSLWPCLWYLPTVCWHLTIVQSSAISQDRCYVNVGMCLFFASNVRPLCQSVKHVTTTHSRRWVLFVRPASVPLLIYLFTAALHENSRESVTNKCNILRYIFIISMPCNVIPT